MFIDIMVIACYVTRIVVGWGEGFQPFQNPAATRMSCNPEGWHGP
jgi:hypothetical protein